MSSFWDISVFLQTTCESFNPVAPRNYVCSFLHSLTKADPSSSLLSGRCCGWTKKKITVAVCTLHAVEGLESHFRKRSAKSPRTPIIRPKPVNPPQTTRNLRGGKTFIELAILWLAKLTALVLEGGKFHSANAFPPYRRRGEFFSDYS